jgi:hypothetical protein
MGGTTGENGVLIQVDASKSDQRSGPSSMLSDDYSLPPKGLKQLGREADHSPPLIADVTNAWSHVSIPHMNADSCV